MGCGCSSGGDGKGLSASEIKDETVAIVNKHTDKFIKDFEDKLEPKLIAKGATGIEDEDSLDIAECKKLREDLFASSFETRSEELKDVIMADVNENLMPEVEEGLPDNEMVRKIALKTAVTVIDATVEQTLKATFNDLKDPPFFDRRLRQKLLALVEAEFGAVNKLYVKYVDEQIKAKGLKTRDDLPKEDRKELLAAAAKDLPRDPVEEKINAQVEARIMPDIERKMERRGLEKGSFKARGALMVVKAAVESTVEQALKGYLKGLAKKDQADQMAAEAIAAGRKVTQEAQKYEKQANEAVAMGKEMHGAGKEIHGEFKR
eukprot:TRINITY_DN4487_c0_g3_i1.p1 TRINITY_DN4487_c0_g3~~TRINITY_DN4487_c0_g3_i1.p1  ORF type:complete len:319 (-),score=136.09 TRINITY_DN4487_c0_g3_i1:261-1217(-)